MSTTMALSRLRASTCPEESVTSCRRSRCSTVERTQIPTVLWRPGPVRAATTPVQHKSSLAGFVLHLTHLQVVSLNTVCFREVHLYHVRGKVIKIKKIYILCPQPKPWSLTFSEISPDSSPELDVAVEDDSSCLHPDTLQPGSAPEPGRVVGAPQDVVDRGGPAPSRLMELPPP